MFPELDNEAIRQVILRELKRQHVDFATVQVYEAVQNEPFGPYKSQEIIATIELPRHSDLTDQTKELKRVENQITRGW